MSQEESASPEPWVGADGPNRECEQQKANVWSTCEHSSLALQVRGEMQRPAPNRALSNVLTMFREGFPLAALNAINWLRLLTPAPVIFHLLLNNFRDMKVMKANPGEVRSHQLLCAEDCHFLALYPASNLHGLRGAGQSPSKYPSNGSHGSM